MGQTKFSTAPQQFAGIEEADMTATNTSRHAARREQILAAAIDCVRHSGFHGASMAMIAKAAELSVGQIYRYFANKEAIITAIVAKDLAESHEVLVEIEGAPGDPLDVLVEKCGSGVKTAYDADRATVMLEVMAEAARNPKVAAVVRAADMQERTYTQHLLKKICGDRYSDAELAVRGEVLKLLFDGMAIRSVNNPDVDKEDLARRVQSVVRYALLS